MTVPPGLTLPCPHCGQQTTPYLVRIHLLPGYLAVPELRCGGCYRVLVRGTGMVARALGQPNGVDDADCAEQDDATEDG